MSPVPPDNSSGPRPVAPLTASAAPGTARNLRYCLVLAAVPLVCAAFWCWLVSLEYNVATPSSAAVGQLVERKLALAAATPSPKLVVLAGSSVHEGFSAAAIQSALGVPTVNMGTGGPLRLAYIFSLGRRAARPGDTVLLSIEYSLYRAGTISDVMLDQALAHDPEYITAKPLRERLQILLSISPARLLEGLRRKRSHAAVPVPPLSTNANGDATGNVEATRDVPAIRAGVPDEMDELPADCTGFLEVSAFVRWCREHKIRVLATFPNTLHFPAYDTPKAKRFFGQIRSLYARLDVPVLGTPEEFMYPEPLFYNTMYHLTTHGVALRTAQTLAELRPYFPAAPPTASR